MNNNTVNWADIAAECGSYKDGFVAVFRRYEGQPTDEKDGSGRVVKVTAASFADHFGIAGTSFRRWIKAAEVATSAATTSRSKSALTRDVKRAAHHEPDAVVEGILAAPQRTQDAIFDELKLRRAGVDTSPANRKAAEASAHGLVAPFNRMIAATGLALCQHMLQEATEILNEAISEGVVTDEALEPIVAASDEFLLALNVAQHSITKEGSNP